MLAMRHDGPQPGAASAPDATEAACQPARFVAMAPNRAEALAAILDALLDAAIPDRPDAALATVALPIRAERPDLGTLTLALGEALMAEVAEAAGQVAAVRLDGLRRTDGGLTAWGYAFAAPRAGEAPRIEIEIDRAEAAETAGTVRIALDVTLGREQQRR
jgi:hypothetical protein